MTRSKLVLFTGAVLGLALAGCSSDSVSAPSAPAANAVLNTQAVNADVAITAASAVMSDLDNFAAGDVLGGIAASRNIPISASDNPAPSSGDTAHTTEDHPAGTLPTVTANSCTVDFVKIETRCDFHGSSNSSSSTITFVDATGHKTDGFKPGVTDTVRTTLVASSQIVSHDSAYTGVFHRNSNRAVGGFLQSQGDRTTNGAGSGADTISFRDGAKTRSYAGVTVDSVKALVFAEHRSVNPYPKSGSMVLVIHTLATGSDGTTTKSEQVDRRVVATYDGTATATLLVGTMSCQLHLDTRKVDSCH